MADPNFPDGGPRFAPPTPPPPPPPSGPVDVPRVARKQRRRSLFAPITGGILGSALTVGALWMGGIFDQSDPVQTLAPSTTQPIGVVAEQTVAIEPVDSSQIAAAAAKAVPSIVTVEIGDMVTIGEGENQQSQFHIFATGSGVVFRSDGYILTNNHVVEDAVITKVIFFDGRRHEAEIVGRDPLTDLAVIKVDETGLPAIEFAPPNDVAIGDPAIAVGNPLGLDGGPSVTAGVISAVDRTLQVGLTVNDSLHGLLQTDAPITRGSSGGALLDVQGRLIGITTAIGVSDVGAEGLGFAIPVDLAERIATDLINDGQIRHAYLGISINDWLTTTESGIEIPSGAEITQLIDTAAMATAGARVGDVIVSLDGKTIPTKESLLATLRSYRAGDTVDIGLQRDGEDLTITVVLDLRPDDL